jgi:hypothetical protein
LPLAEEDPRREGGAGVEEEEEEDEDDKENADEDAAASAAHAARDSGNTPERWKNACSSADQCSCGHKHDDGDDEDGDKAVASDHADDRAEADSEAPRLIDGVDGVKPPNPNPPIDDDAFESDIDNDDDRCIDDDPCCCGCCCCHAAHTPVNNCCSHGSGTVHGAGRTAYANGWRCASVRWQRRRVCSERQSSVATQAGAAPAAGPDEPDEPDEPAAVEPEAEPEPDPNPLEEEEEEEDERRAGFEATADTSEIEPLDEAAKAVDDAFVAAEAEAETEAADENAA